MASLLHENLIIFHILVCLSILLLHVEAKPKHHHHGLEVYYYKHTCPFAEKIIREEVHKASIHDYRVPPRLLRMFFHDCFVRGCDASILLDSMKHHDAEKDADINMSIRSYYVIDKIKKKLEKACPKTVSCADIIALAARDVVVLAGGPYWDVPTGRKDGKISNAKEAKEELPVPSFNTTKLIKNFKRKGLSIKDLVALSGAHTIGFSHCSSFEARLHDFNKDFDFDPSMDFILAQTLKEKCPHKHKRSNNAGYHLDSSYLEFDNEYYRRLIARRGVLHSDQSLYNDYRTKFLVESYAKYETLFFMEFSDAMVKVGNLGAKDHHKGEVRKNCRLVNKKRD
ncbi:peroxidase 66-like [Amaranthus tricolor]|uniref:peroxidase 66-like n=1 Tax=Amaranthus tricolor TaxID=29722 RepID=UPI0025908009|nr:peroxidase 66-like [Amaranthus tricolor]